tara:strand:+ start:463 stop:729 length:267 start_codon:yes stop_codon:yes gene_type:complete
MTDDLVKRLRFLASGQNDPHSLASTEAADRIEALQDAMGSVLQSTTLRDQFAMAAMTGLMAINPAKASLKVIAEFSYIAADSMMEARK